MALLKEAAESNCSHKRRMEIQGELSKALAVDEDAQGEGIDLALGIQLVFDTLYLEAVENNPGKLPDLFPFFAMACGVRRESSLVAEIDWSLKK